MRSVRPVGAVLPVVAVLGALAVPFGAGGAGGPGPADAVSALLVLYCALRLARARRRPLAPVAAVVLGLPVAGIALAAMGAGSPAAGFAGLGRYLQVFVLVPAAVVLLVRDRSGFRLVAWAFVGLALWQGAVGTHQYVTGTGASYQGAYVRAVGTFGPADVMGMASVVALGVVCAVGLALGGESGVRRRVAAAGCALVLLPPLALSFSRGAWIATAVACAAQLLLAGVRRAVRVGAAAVAAAVVLVGGFGVGSALLQERVGSITRVTDAPDQSVLDRYALWTAAVGIWRDHPLTGVGLKNFPEYRDAYAPLALSAASDTEGAGAAFRRQPLLSPHNMYLLVLSEQGLAGLVALAGSWLALLVCGLRRVRASAFRHRCGPGGGLDCALVACGLLVWQLTDFGYGDIGGPSTVLTAVSLGLAACWALAGGGVPETDAPEADALEAGVPQADALVAGVPEADVPLDRTGGRAEGRAVGRAGGRGEGVLTR
ncbi:O-antigen ligase family protein [Streptomyces sp. NPDC047017]|uniref:O-antigen ligase family protein n=1 Tax=Streptomyces sp. NPDC047017 TaxID=3155024 RepID=UPI0033DF34BE